jgi:hypothetical protein
MKPFTLDNEMVNIAGAFYPTGCIFAMFPTAEDARGAARKLESDGRATDAIGYLTPDDVMGKVVRTVGNADIPLPSAGTESDTVRHYAELASKGHHALLIPADSTEEADHVAQVLQQCHASYAQRYRRLVIEDVVT